MTMSKPLVIAFSGGCFSGKTTTMEKLKELLEKRGHKVAMLSELVREHKIESIDKLRQDPSAYLKFQQDIILEKIDAELNCTKLDVDVVLVDRAITDSLFYLMFYVDKSRLSFDDIALFYSLQNRTRMHMKQAFEQIYHLVIEFSPINAVCDDKVFRPKQIGALKYIEHDIISMLNEFAMPCTLGKYIRCDLNTQTPENLILKIVERFKL